MTTEPTQNAPDGALGLEQFDELDTILDDLRTRDDEIPQWEFCEGFMAALVCCRRPLVPAEFLPVLLGFDPAGACGAAVFADTDQFERFMELWTQRWKEISTALDLNIESLNDDGAYQPEVMDLRAAIAALPPEQRAEMGDAPIPSFGQIWAIGFMYAVENWAEEWEPPKDPEASKMVNGALECIVALTEDDTEEPTIGAFEEDGEPTLSKQRLNDFADALWAVYDLRDVWLHIGPRVETVYRVETPGRNDLCSCGSGKKYKKCCGAN
ncbi:YecA/YgfB family protein [Rhodoferax antarcticus]|uniref:Zinc chelation protein SecC n=1 Tax=Rhodoferax antarcticus ANT.BR TaxID=1111071 RepID=A0A1Q8YJD6_9BURK|nr:YecA family protein [Rhodoferax antarcticus]APW47812.1 zinc chelation protein SecC [Rhodoferax antarcticus]MCW2312350.1 uncharacterized protein [Rhodoferax antarcticus]OLP08039.1 zinc chelation protein SecC [Rhodoferax antarcticus ANT.BR]